MLGVSTSWLSGKTESGGEVAEEIRSLGPDAIELEYRIDSATYAQLRPLLKKYEIDVSSVHNFFPIPDILDRGSGDAFLFTSDDNEERELAVKYTKKTVQQASDLEAKIVILHLGKIPLKTNLDRLYELFDQDRFDTDEAAALKENLTRERGKKAHGYVDRVLLCLNKLLPVAEKYGIIIGIENRYHYHEIPSQQEIGLILKEFEGAPIAYWHDVGHAHNLESVGLCRRQDLLDVYGSKMAGIHLHDARGREDHFAPGTGDIDFSQIKPYLKSEMIKIVEVHPKVAGKELLKSIGFLRDLGIF